MIFNLSEKKSIGNAFIAELRNVEVQSDRMRFRKNLERLGEIMAYEISKTLDFGVLEVETPLGISEVEVPIDTIVLGTILRAGLPLHQGLLNIYDDADSAFVSAYRKHHKNGSFDIKVEYVSCPNIEDTVLVVADPMLATGASMVAALQALLEQGKPKAIHIVVAVAARDGLDYVRRHFPTASIWVGAIDEELTGKSYIVPGLGDAGDLAYGNKLQE